MFTASEQRAVFAILLHSALADGTKSDGERSALKRITEGFGADGFNPWSVYQEVLGGRFSIAAAVVYLEREPARMMAYEMALGVCETDGPPDEKERAFLAELRTSLGLSGGAGVKQAEQEALAVAEAVPGAGLGAAAVTAAGAAAMPPPLPLGTAADAGAGAKGKAEPETTRLMAVDLAAVEKRILNHAILAGALELLPQSLATMAVVPLQMKLVFGVGKAHGYALDRGHIKDFLATAGAGLAAQAVEGYARKLLGGLVGGVLGKGMLGGLGRAAVSTGAGAAITFAATYAIGQLALRYYGGGRKMEVAVLKDTYAKLLGDGRRLFGIHQGEVERRAATLTPSEVINLVRQP